MLSKLARLNGSGSSDVESEETDHSSKRLPGERLRSRFRRICVRLDFTDNAGVANSTNIAAMSAVVHSDFYFELLRQLI